MDMKEKRFWISSSLKPDFMFYRGKTLCGFRDTKTVLKCWRYISSGAVQSHERLRWNQPPESIQLWDLLRQSMVLQLSVTKGSVSSSAVQSGWECGRRSLLASQTAEGVTTGVFGAGRAEISTFGNLY